MKTIDYWYAVASSIAAKGGVSLSKAAKAQDSIEALEMLAPSISRPLLRIGGSGYGSYFIPDDLHGVSHCFSPGVGPSSMFELDLAQRGIQVMMADASVKAPAAKHENFKFRPDFVAAYSDAARRRISLDDWVRSELGDKPHGDLLLQMDIEGCEYEVLHSVSEPLLQKFRIVVIEFHHLNQLRHGIMCGYMKSALIKLLNHFSVCHVEANWMGGGFSVCGKRYPRLLEVSLLRKSNIQSTASRQSRELPQA